MFRNSHTARRGLIEFANARSRAYRTPGTRYQVVVTTISSSHPTVGVAGYRPNVPERLSFSTKELPVGKIMFLSTCYLGLAHRKVGWAG